MQLKIIEHARKKALARFEKNIAPEAISGCWIWLGSLTGFGYGRLTNEEGVVMLAHRWSYRRFISEDMPPVVMHICDNPACVNPAHLQGGTQLMNMFDMWEKGRGKPPKIMRDQCHLTRYTRDQLDQVKRLREHGLTQTKITEITGISQSHVSRILNGAVV